MCRLGRGQRRRPSTPTRRQTIGAGSAIVVARPEDLLELVRRRDLQLVVPAVGRPLVGAPAKEDRGVAEPISLHMVVLDLADPLDPERFPREILARAPAALTARHPCRLT